MYVLGIDAGGTKTVCYLANAAGEILGEGRRGGANLQAHGELEVEKVLHSVIEEAIGDRPILPAAVCLGVAGVDRPDDDHVVRAIMRRLGYRSHLLVVNDALIALVAVACAIVGWVTCAVGLVGAVRMHLVLGDPAPPSPWDSTHDGPMAIAELFPSGLNVEGVLFGAIMMAAMIALLRDAVRR